MSEKAKKSPNWSQEEVTTLLDLMLEQNVMQSFDDKKTRNSEIYRMLSQKLAERGFHRLPDQLKHKFTKLKSEFMAMRITTIEVVWHTRKI